MLLALSAAFTSCAPKPKVSEITLNITPSMAITNINMDGGALVYGKRTDGIGSWGKVFRPGEPVIVDMAFGKWNFSIIAYAGPSELSGAIECAVLNDITIGEEKEVVDVLISPSACAIAGVRELNLIRCNGTNFNSNPLVSCSLNTGIESYQIKALGHRTRVPTGNSLTSDCITETNFSGASVPKIPTGISNISVMPFELIAYTGTNCDAGTELTLSFPTSLSEAPVNGIKVFTTASKQFVAINNDSADIDTIGPTVTINNVAAVLESGTNESITFSYSDTNGVVTHLLQFAADGTNFGTIATNPASAFSWTVPSTDTTGSKLRLVATDNAGNVTIQETSPFNIDNSTPVIAVLAGSSFPEGSPITPVDVYSVSGGDTDANGDAIIYTCQFDTTIDASVGAGTDCNSLPGVAAFSASTGVLTWTPDYSSANTYEFLVVGTESSFSRVSPNLIFSMSITNTDRPPILTALSDEIITEGVAITQVNAEDTTNGDSDIDGDPITFSCEYDITIDGSVVGGTSCASLPGSPSFTAATGVFDWTPDLFSVGTYEIKITATSNALIDTEIFTITVTDTVPPAEATLNGSNWVTPASSFSKTLVVGTWTPSTDSDLTNQRIYFYEKTGCTGNPIKVELLANNITTYTFHAPNGDTTYSYRLTMIDEVNNESAGLCSTDITVDQGHMSYSGDYLDGVIVGNYLYATNGKSVDIFDINTTPLDPVIVSSLRARSSSNTPQSANIKRIIHESGYLYLVGIGSLFIFDVGISGTPLLPLYLGKVDHNMSGVVDAISTGSYLFMLDDNGIIAFDLATPSLPALLNGGAEYSTSPDITCKAIIFDPINNRLYTACGTNITPFDISTFPSSAPTREAPIGTSLAALSDIEINVTTQQIHAIEDSFNGGYKRYNISPPSNLSQSGSKTNFNEAKRIGNIDESISILFACANGDRGATHDITPSIPSTPDRTTTITNSECNLVVGNSTHYYTLAETGIYAGAIGGGIGYNDPSPIGEGISFSDISIFGNNAVVATLTDRVKVLDVTNPHSPSEIGTIVNTGSLVNNVELFGNTAFTLSGLSFSAHDISALPSATELWRITLTSSSNDAMAFNHATSPTYAFIGGTGANIKTVDLGGQTEIASIVACSGDKAREMKFVSNFLYVTCGTNLTLEIYDASDPAGAGLTLVSNVSSLPETATGLKVFGSYAYVAVGTSGFTIIDISTPASAFIVSTYNGVELAGTVKNIYAQSGFLFVTDTSTIFSYDISTPTTPSYLTKFSTNNLLSRGDLIPNQYLFLTNGEYGLEIFDIANPLYIHQ